MNSMLESSKCYRESATRKGNKECQMGRVSDGGKVAKFKCFYSE